MYSEQLAQNIQVAIVDLKASHLKWFIVALNVLERPNYIESIFASFLSYFKSKILWPNF